MKKKISILISILCVVCFVFVLASCDGADGSKPDGETGSGTEITYPEGTVSVDNGYKPNVPEDPSVDYSKAFVIEDNVVVGLTKYGRTLSKLVIPDGVTAIGDGAFACDDDDVFEGRCNLVSVEIPNSVTSIGNEAFYININLASVNLPDNLVSIGSWAFIGCVSLTELVIPNSVTSIGEDAIMQCTSLVIKSKESNVSQELESSLYWEDANYKIPLVVNCLSNEVADDGYIYVVADNGVQYALKDGIAKVTGHTYGASGDLKIASVVGYKGKTYVVKEVSDMAFLLDIDITTVDISDDVTSIGEMAFADCMKITEVDLPDSLTYIGVNAFNDCASLTSVSIPSSVREIDEQAFAACEVMDSVVFEENSQLTIIGDGAFTFCSSLESIEIPSSVTTIEGSAFASSGLTSIKIPSGVTSIGDGAFSNCKALTNVEISSSVTSLGNGAFYQCSNLESVTFGENSQLETIKSSAFFECEKLTSIVIPSSVISVGQTVFSGCNALTVYCEAESQPSGWDNNWNSTNCPVVWGYKK